LQPNASPGSILSFRLALALFAVGTGLELLAATPCSDAIRFLPIRFRDTAIEDVLVYRPNDGGYAKWYGAAAISPAFAYQPGRFVDGQAGSWRDVAMVPGDFDGDGNADVLVYNPRDGRFAKWYGSSAVGSAFDFQPTRVAGGGSPGWDRIAMVPADFDGDRKTDVLVYRPEDGAFAKWYSRSDGARSPDFDYQPASAAGGLRGAWSGVVMLPADFDGDGRTDILIYRPESARYEKWYAGSSQPSPVFDVQPSVLFDADWHWIEMLPADFNGDRRTDFLVYQPGDGLFAKAYSDPTGAVSPRLESPNFAFAGGSAGAWSGMRAVAADLDGDGRSDVVVYRPADGAFAKWYSSNAGVNNDFDFHPSGFAGGVPGSWAGLEIVAANLDGDARADLLVYRPWDGAFAKWYDYPRGSRSAVFLYQAVGYAGGRPRGWVSDRSSVPGAVTGRVFFGADCTPLRSGRVRIWDDDDTSADDLMAETITDAFGRYQVGYDVHKDWDARVVGSNSYRPDVYATVGAPTLAGFMRAAATAPLADALMSEGEVVDLPVERPPLRPTLSGRCMGLERRIVDGYNIAVSRLVEITAAELRGCMRNRHHDGDLVCEDDCDVVDGANELGYEGTGATIHLCANMLADARPFKVADVVLHEWAHTCGWEHGEGKGVPGNNGCLSCPP
jgi:hypothetical protein